MMFGEGAAFFAYGVLFSWLTLWLWGYGTTLGHIMAAAVVLTSIPTAWLWSVFPGLLITGALGNFGTLAVFGAVAVGTPWWTSAELVAIFISSSVLLAWVRHRAAGRIDVSLGVSHPVPSPEPARVPDLMAVLEESVEIAKAGRKAD